MSNSIENLKSMLNHQISGGALKLNVYVNDKSPSEMNCIILFYSGTGEFGATNTKAPYYDTRVQVAVRHSNYDQARTSAFSAIEFINARRKTISGVYWIPVDVPIYQGQDIVNGGYLWTFNISMKGGK